MDHDWLCPYAHHDNNNTNTAYHLYLYHLYPFLSLSPLRHLSPLNSVIHHPYVQ